MFTGHCLKCNRYTPNVKTTFDKCKFCKGSLDKFLYDEVVHDIVSPGSNLKVRADTFGSHLKGIEEKVKKQVKYVSELRRRYERDCQLLEVDIVK